MNENTKNIRDKILDAALPLVVFEGWTKDTLRQASVDAGYDECMVKAVFPDGVIGVLDHFADRADQVMLKKLSDVNSEELRIRYRVQTALIKRYEFLNEYKEEFKEMLSYLSIPTRKPRAAKMVWRTADRIWQWAGDTATDYNRYTKRSLLVAVIVPTTLVWLNDENSDMAITQEFLGRRIENVMKVGKFGGELMQRFKKGKAA